MNIGRYMKLFGIGPLGILISTALLGLLWLLDRQLGHLEIISQYGPIKTLGMVIIALWACWHLWCLKTIRMWWTKERLCTTGPYRFVRHPMYAGGLSLAQPGIALLFNSWIIFLLPVISYPVWSVLVRKEEMMMAAVFGEEYKSFAARTGRLFPRIFR